MKKINYLILLVVVFVGISCEPTYEKEYSWAYPVAGDWTVTAYIDGEAQTDPFEIKSYNTAFGKDSIWVDDYPVFNTTGALANWNFWGMKFKVAVDMTTKTFTNGTDSVINAIDDYRIGIKVTNGKIVGTDSITMDVEFGDDPGTIYQLAGHRTTSYDGYMGH